MSFTIGASISIRLAAAVSHTSVMSTMVHGTVMAETEKAVQVRAVDEAGNDGWSCWLPKKALVAIKDGKVPVAGLFKMAHWFKPVEYTARFLNRYGVARGISVA